MKWIVLAWIALVAVSARAFADDENVKPSYRIVIDRIDHEPASITGSRLAIFVSALTLQGQQLDLHEPNTIKTLVGSSELRAPFAIGHFSETNERLAIVVVVQATLEYQEVLPIVLEQLDQTLLTHLDEKTLVAILPYGETVGTGKLAPLKAARAKLANISQDGTAGDPALVETVERALILLKKAKTDPEGIPLRKLILLVGDGRDRVGDKDRVTRLGVRAAKESVRIHSFAYSPSDQRRPLLLLGELSRKSLGTFRWLQIGQADSWAAKFQQMLDEILKQYVLTYFVGPDDDPGGKKLKVTTVGRIATVSNDAKIPASLCNGEECGGYCVANACVIPRAPEGRGVFGWILLVGGIGIGAIVLLGLVGFVISKRQQPIPLPPEMAGVVGIIAPGVPGPAKKQKAQKKQKPVPMPAGPPMPQGIAYMMFVSGPRTGERVMLHNNFLVGKVPGNHLIIEDGYTSSNHAQIAVDAQGQWHVYDRGSTNGTFIDGNRVTDQVLTSGVTLRFGGTDLRFLVQ
ncbi:MAG: FHA domain-containing protein [Kofleriaceae bacterium]